MKGARTQQQKSIRQQDTKVDVNPETRQQRPVIYFAVVCLQGYRPCAQRASILFFVLNDMGRIDPMYQFSLDAYIELFMLSIEKSSRSSKLEERINNLNDYHTYAVYRYVTFHSDCA